MSVPRLFSILRRKPGMIDLITPIRPQSENVVSYRLKKDSDPAGAFTNTVLTAPRTGLVDPTLAGNQHVIQPGENVRIIFNPVNYTFATADEALWIKLVYVDGAGAEMVSPAPSAPTLVLPPYVGNLQTGFTATAPTKADLAHALQLDLPRSMENLRITNYDGTNSMFFAADPGGPEIEIPAGKEISGFYGLVSTMYVRATGAGVKFTATFTYANPR